ncbi:MAG: FmdE family protein [Desulfovermiculus sp.]|nr:FmdE family protein [Desulfovermiculus sp.]
MLRKAFLAITCLACFFFIAVQVWATSFEYSAAKELGTYATNQAAKDLDTKWNPENCIALTNAGYARPNGQSSLGCLDGIAAQSKATPGQGTLIRLQSRFDQPLWFAFYARKSGQCAYYQLEADKAAQALSNKQSLTPSLFTRKDTARIDADFLFAHSQKFQNQAQKGLFGSNLFRVVTVANAADRNCPDYVLTALQVHDHYCPGVSSGLMLTAYTQEYILKSSPQTECFVLSINPWCKEDALITLLNATPGKKGYGVLYPTEKEVTSWPKPLNQVDTVVFTQENNDQAWHGWLLGFDFDRARQMQDLPKFDSVVVDKLAADRWFLDRLDRPEKFVSVLKEVELEDGASPRDLLKPGSNPVHILADMPAY